MTQKTLRKPAPRMLRRPVPHSFDISDGGDLGALPEVVFDRVTGPFSSGPSSRGAFGNRTTSLPGPRRPTEDQ